MTADERAEALVEELYALVMTEQTRDREIEMIAAAIRSAENEALEKAAVLAGKHATACGVEAKFNQHHGRLERQREFEAMSDESEDISIAIRALKHKET